MKATDIVIGSSYTIKIGANNVAVTITAATFFTLIVS